LIIYSIFIKQGNEQWIKERSKNGWKTSKKRNIKKKEIARHVPIVGVFYLTIKLMITSIVSVVVVFGIDMN